MLTAAQKTIVKADILANADLNDQPNTPDGAAEIARLYNLAAQPDYYVWRTAVSVAEVNEKVVWTEYIGFTTAAERDTFLLMLSNGSLNAGDPNVRQGIADIFSGAGKATTRTQLTDLAKRTATRLEKLLATGTGLLATPSTMGREGPVAYQDVFEARNS